jgi:DNA invertase Pin-like site-specific DNA recombinase
MERCLANDKIYISELSRLGRSMTDLFYIINYLCDKGVTVIQCKDGTIIENKSIGGKALLFALSLAAEIEVQNIRQRTKAGLDARKELKKQQGFWLSKTGNRCTHFGREKGCKVSPEAIAATSVAQMENASRWREKSVAYQVYKQKKRAGWSDVKILDLFREMSEVDPANYLSRKGKPITASTLSRWNGYLRQEDYIVTTA